MRPETKITFTELYMNDQKIFFQHLGRRLADFRKEQGLTQVQMAEIADCSQQLIAEYEAGRLNIPVWRLLSIAEVLNVSVDELLKDSKKTFRKRGPASKMERQIEQVRKLPKSDQVFVSQLLDNVISKARAN